MTENGLIRDPFDSSEAIMPSGNIGAKVFCAPVGTMPLLRPEFSTPGWIQLGWAEPGQFLNTGHSEVGRD